MGLDLLEFLETWIKIAIVCFIAVLFILVYVLNRDRYRKEKQADELN